MGVGVVGTIICDYGDNYNIAFRQNPKCVLG